MVLVFYTNPEAPVQFLNRRVLLISPMSCSSASLVIQNKFGIKLHHSLEKVGGLSVEVVCWFNCQRLLLATGIVANTLNLFRLEAVGFIESLGIGPLRNHSDRL